MSDKQVANLIGGVEFKVDLSQLERLFAELQKTERKLRAFGRFAEKPIKLSVGLDTRVLDKQLTAIDAKLRKSLGITAPGVGKGTQTTAHRHDMQAQRLERANQQARQATFAAELQQQKLLFAGKRDEVMLTTASLKAEQQAAVLAAKQAAARAAANKELITQVALEERIAKAKATQLRTEQLLTAARNQAAISQQKYLQSLTATQRQQLSLDQARERGERQREQAQERRQLQLSRESRAQDGAEQRRGRYRMAEEKHASWKQRQLERSQRQAAGGRASGGMDASTLSLGAGSFGRVGAIGLAAAGAVAGLQSMNSQLNSIVERIAQNDRMKIVTGNAVGGSDQRKENFQNWFAQTANELGVSYVDNVQPVSAMVGSQREMGKGTREAIGNARTVLELQAIYHSTTEQARNISTQLGQVFGKGKVEQDDLSALVEGGGITPLRTFLQRQWAKETGYKGDDLGTAYAKAQRGGTVTADMLMNAMKLIVSENQPKLQEYQKGVQANAIRRDNESYLRTQAFYTDPEVLDSTNKLIEAQRQLGESTEGLQKAFVSAQASVMDYVAKQMKDFVGDDPNNPDKKGWMSDVGDAASELGDSWGAFKDRMLGALPWLKYADDATQGPGAMAKSTGGELQGIANGLTWLMDQFSGRMPPQLFSGEIDARAMSNQLMPNLSIDRGQLAKMKEGILRNNALNDQVGQQVSNVTNNTTNSGNTTTVTSTNNNTFNITSNDPEGVRREVSQQLDQQAKDMMNRATSSDVPK